mmetsp:Transcript_108/g.282  ORF Transcript_108/g.282 Transcript_108/m.282 type:complete len:220 (-) Transcript_108:614-1273(-)
MPRGLDGLVQRQNDVLAGREWRAHLEVLRKGLARDGHARAIDQPMLHEILEHSRRATHLVQILHDIFATRLQVGDERHLVANPLEVIQSHLHPARIRHGDQMQHRIRAAPRRHHEHDRILKTGLGHNVPGLDVPLHQLEQIPPRQPALNLLQGILRRCRTRIRQTHSHCLDRRCHRVGRVHPPACPRARAGILHNIRALLLLNEPRRKPAIRLERRNNI